VTFGFETHRCTRKTTARRSRPHLGVLDTASADGITSPVPVAGDPHRRRLLLQLPLG
jgi:hypothetical protein